MMVEGITTVLEYCWPDRVPRYLEPRPTGYAGQGAIDPNWYVWHADPNNPSSAEYEWIHYVTLDGSLWSVKLHCRRSVLVSVGIIPYFEHKPFLGGPDHDAEVMNFLDWDGRPWQAKALNVNRSPWKPRFQLKKLFGKSFTESLFVNEKKRPTARKK